MAGNTFFYALIIVGVLIALFLFLRRGETCGSCSENFTQKLSFPIQEDFGMDKEAEYRRKKRRKMGTYHKYVPAIVSEGESNHHLSFDPPTEPWPGYNKLSLYSQKVIPPNLDNYPYMNSPYNQVMNSCAMGCSDKECLSDCVLHTLPPVQ
jgi:hypothetical protein